MWGYHDIKNLWLCGGAGRQIRRSVGIENVDREHLNILVLRLTAE